MDLEKLKGCGFKLTPQRLAIARYLEGNTTHPTAARIYGDLKKQDPRLNMATVYNTLHAFRKAGLLKTLVLHDNAVHYDPDTSEHHHFFCIRCEKIMDVTHKEITKDLRKMKNKLDHDVEKIVVMINGFCKKCSLTKNKRRMI